MKQFQRVFRYSLYREQWIRWGGCGSGVKKVYNKFDAAGKEDITWKLYDNDRHEILNETDRDVVYHDIRAWMNVHLA